MSDYEATAREFMGRYVNIDEAEYGGTTLKALTALLHLAVKEERAACASACSRLAKTYERRSSEDAEGAELHLHMATGANACAGAIRARKDAP